MDGYIARCHDAAEIPNWISSHNAISFSLTKSTMGPESTSVWTKYKGDAKVSEPSLTSIIEILES